MNLELLIKLDPHTDEALILNGEMAKLVIENSITYIGLVYNQVLADNACHHPDSFRILLVGDLFNKRSHKLFLNTQKQG